MKAGGRASRASRADAASWTPARGAWMPARGAREPARGARRAERWILLVLVLDAALVGILAAVAWFTPVTVPELTADALATAGRTPYRPYMGILSHLGFLLWCATATLCLYAWARARAASRPATASFYLGSAALTTVLMFDDLLMLHEDRELYFYVAYVLAGAVYLLWYRREILTREALIFAGALAAFGASVLLDVVPFPGPVPAQFLLEDGAKFAGISLWASFFARACWSELPGGIVPSGGSG